MQMPVEVCRSLPAGCVPRTAWHHHHDHNRMVPVSLESSASTCEWLLVHRLHRKPSGEAERSLFRELEAARSIHTHPNLLPVLGVVADPHGTKALLSSMPEATLEAVLRAPPLPLTWADALLAITTDVACGLAHLHEHKLFHGRLCPTTIVLTQQWVARLVEYGADALHGTSLRAASAMYAPGLNEALMMADAGTEGTAEAVRDACEGLLCVASAIQ